MSVKPVIKRILGIKQEFACEVNLCLSLRYLFVAQITQITWHHVWHNTEIMCDIQFNLYIKLYFVRLDDINRHNSRPFSK